MSEEEEDDEISEILTNNKKKTKKNEDEIVSEYIESFKEYYDSKLNNYFKILNQSMLDVGNLFKQVLVFSFFCFFFYLTFISFEFYLFYERIWST